ncbi:MAG: hypothetical protein LBR74_00035 [Eubacterium sp.]|nr:hypothetical protein [Eubacterium sp.]
MKKILSEIVILYDNNILCDFETKKVLDACKCLLSSLKIEHKDITVTFLKYTDAIETITLNRPIDMISFKNLVPEKTGACALIDCAVEAITKIGDRYAAQPCEEHPEKVIFLLTVCGKENASKHHTYKELNDMIRHQTDAYKWSFFMITDDTANYENIDICPENTILFDSGDIDSLKIASEGLGHLMLRKINE